MNIPGEGRTRAGKQMARAPWRQPRNVCPTHAPTPRGPAPPNSNFENSTNQLSGTLPPELGSAWKGVQGLELQRNGFSGPLPKEWAAMGGLLRLLLQ